MYDLLNESKWNSIIVPLDCEYLQGYINRPRPKSIFRCILSCMFKGIFRGLLRVYPGACLAHFQGYVQRNVMGNIYTLEESILLVEEESSCHYGGGVISSLCREVFPREHLSTDRIVQYTVLLLQ